MKRNKLIYVVLFALLYFAVGLVSTIHAVSFFSLANTTFLAIMLAIAFEIGQAAVLFDILTNPNDRKKFMPWALMCLLTFVQILGNVYSSYKYLITNSIDSLRFFKEPVFVWMSLPDDVCNVILTYLIGAILPVVSLCLSEMVTTRLNESEEQPDIKQEQIEEVEEDQVEQEVAEQSVELPKVNNVEETEEQPEVTTLHKQEADSHFVNL